MVGLSFILFAFCFCAITVYTVVTDRKRELEQMLHEATNDDQRDLIKIAYYLNTDRDKEARNLFHELVKKRSQEEIMWMNYEKGTK